MEIQISQRNNELAKLAYQRIEKSVLNCGTIDLGELRKFELAELRRLAKHGIYVMDPNYSHEFPYK